MRKIAKILLLGILLYASQSHAQPSDASTVNVRSANYFASYCIYYLEDQQIDTDVIAHKISAKLVAHKRVDNFSEDMDANEFVVEYVDNPMLDYPAPDLEYLEYKSFGLSTEEKMGLQTPRSAVIVAFTGSNQEVVSDQLTMNKIMASLLKGSQTILTDYVTYETYNESSWQQLRLNSFTKSNQYIPSQFTIHLYRDGEFCRAVTLGLGKFCLPDISIQQISCLDQDSYANLINLISQTLLENPTLSQDSVLHVNINSLQNTHLKKELDAKLADNAERKGLIQLTLVEPQEGDAFNTQFELVFNDDQYTSKQEEQNALISQVFGATDEITYVDHNAELLAASERAKQKLPELRNKFNDGLEPGHALLLKLPFETDSGGNEWMWVEVTKWSGSDIKGILQNDPFEIANLKAGARVEGKQEDVFDYIYYYADGTSEGNETGAIIMKGN